MPNKSIDEEVQKLCDGVRMDIEVINLINQYKVYMPLEEQRVVINSVKGIYQGMKNLTLNYA